MPRGSCRARDRSDSCWHSPRDGRPSIQQTEFRYTGRGADEYLSVRNRRRDELVAGSELVAPVWRLGAVVELVRQIGGVEGVQHRGIGVLVCPDDAVARTVRRDGGRCAWEYEAQRGTGGGRGGEPRRGDREHAQRAVGRTVVERTVEVRRGGKN